MSYKASIWWDYMVLRLIMNMLLLIWDDREAEWWTLWLEQLLLSLLEDFIFGSECQKNRFEESFKKSAGVKLVRLGWFILIFDYLTVYLWIKRKENTKFKIRFLRTMLAGLVRPAAPFNSSTSPFLTPNNPGSDSQSINAEHALLYSFSMYSFHQNMLWCKQQLLLMVESFEFR